MRFVVFTAILVAGQMLAQVKITKQAAQIDVEIDGKPYSSLYLSGPEVTKPYLHPIRAANGKIVSRVWPMEEKAGEAKDHPHHRGLWFTHGDVNGFDFWGNVKPGPKFGRVVVDKATGKSGKSSGTISFEGRWIDPNDKALLKETRTMT